MAVSLGPLCQNLLLLPAFQHLLLYLQVCTGNNDHVYMHIIFTVSTRFVNEFNPFLDSEKIQSLTKDTNLSTVCNDEVSYTTLKMVYFLARSNSLTVTFSILKICLPRMY